MSKINELIKKYCPIGVEYKKLYEVTIWDKKFNGTTKEMQDKTIKYNYLLAKDLVKIEVLDGNVYILTTGINKEKKYTTEELAGEYLCEGEVIAIPWGGNPNVKYYKGKFVTGDNRIATSKDINILTNKFLYHWMSNKMDQISHFYRGSGIKHPDMKKILLLNIPIPPLPVQEEIVRILDKFTELESELESELEARRLQYQYYRDKLLNFGDYVEYKKIREICNITRGRVISKNYLIQNMGEYPVYSSQTLNNGVFGKINNYDFDGKYVQWTTDGAHAGSVFYRNGKFSVTNVCGLLKVKDGYKEKINTHFLALAFGQVSKKYVNYATSNPKLMSNMVAEIKIPVPPLEEQKRIVSILDGFDKLVNDINEGIPAEIESRRKQYEYYRNKLLTFEAINNE